MEMHQVRYFLTLCETLNFTRAAEQCNVAQPSLTRAIKKLEEEFGGTLFRRERNHTHLTDLGILIKPHLERLQDASLSAQAQAEDFQSLETAPLRLGIMCTIGPARLVKFIENFQREIPNLELTIRDAPGAQLVEDMMSGELDVSFIGLPEFPDRLNAQALYRERYVIAFPRGHRFEAMNAVPLRELDGEDYLARINCEYNDFFDTLSLPMPCKVNIRHQSEREDWIQALIGSGMGCTIMPEYLPTLPDISTRIIVEPDISREISLLTVSGRQYSPSLQTFIRLAQKYDWASGGEAP